MTLFELLNAPIDASAATVSVAVFCAEWLILAVPLVLAALWLSGEQASKRAVVAATLAGIVALLFAQAFSLHYVPRPFAAGVGRTLIAHTPDSSFPSDHATLMAAVAVSLLFVRETRVAGVMLALIWLPMSWARVYVGVHFPSDLLGGALVGTVAALLVKVFAAKLVQPLTTLIQQHYSTVMRPLIRRGWLR
ncbi:MAG: undecaprenyl-diphosphatase [Ramlibacter sp.]